MRMDRSMFLRFLPVRWRRFLIGLGFLIQILVIGVLGYRVLGLGWLDALYQTVITISTVGFREVGEVDAGYQLFTVFLILFGTSTSLYTLGVLLDTMLEARVVSLVRGRHFQKGIRRMSDHVIVCGFGQVGQSIYRDLTSRGYEVVIVDRALDDRAEGGPQMRVIDGDATDDSVLDRAGVQRASALVLALDSDVENLYVALTARSMNKDLFIVARANNRRSISKLRQAGADRVVNPHEIGGVRMAALVGHPEVVDYLDVVMHDGEFEVRMEHCRIATDSDIAERPFGEADVRGRTGATILAVYRDGTYLSKLQKLNLRCGDLLIAIGSEEDLGRLRDLARGRSSA